MADPRLQVVASPVDTAVQPQPPKSLQLAAALSDLSPKLKAAGDVFLAQSIQTTQEKAQRAALISQAADYRDAVKKGEIRAGFNPWFRKAFDEQRGVALGQQIKQGGYQAYEQWDGKNSDDPNDFAKFLDGYLKEQLGGITSPDVLRGAAPEIRVLQNNLGEKHAQYTAKRIEDGLNESVGQSILGSLREMQSADDIAGYNAQIEAAKQRFKATGYDMSRLNDDVFSAVASRALETNDEGWLGLLKLARPDGTPAIGDIPAFNTKIEQTREQIWSNQYHAQQREAAAQRAQQDAFEGQLLDYMQGLRQSNPAGSRVPDDVVFAAQKVLGVGKASEFFSDFDKGFAQSNDQALVEATLAEGRGDARAILRMYQAGRLNAAEFKSYYLGAGSTARSLEASDRARASFARGQSRAVNKGLPDGPPSNTPVPIEGRIFFLPDGVRPVPNSGDLQTYKKLLMSPDEATRRAAREDLVAVTGSEAGADWYTKRLLKTPPQSLQARLNGLTQ